MDIWIIALISILFNSLKKQGRRASNDFPVSVTVSDGEMTPEAEHDVSPAFW
jgi:hypothetical protein